jgi:hypothetical protein
MLQDERLKHLFLTVLDAGKSKIKVLPDLVPGEGLLFADDCLLAVSSQGREGEGKFW